MKFDRGTIKAPKKEAVLMDKTKTGNLIKNARTKKNYTQVIKLFPGGRTEIAFPMSEF